LSIAVTVKPADVKTDLTTIMSEPLGSTTNA
jgi:hypothetical protein